MSMSLFKKNNWVGFYITKVKSKENLLLFNLKKKMKLTENKLPCSKSVSPMQLSRKSLWRRITSSTVLA